MLFDRNLTYCEYFSFAYIGTGEAFRESFSFTSLSLDTLEKTELVHLEWQLTAHRGVSRNESPPEKVEEDEFD